MAFLRRTPPSGLAASSLQPCMQQDVSTSSQPASRYDNLHSATAATDVQSCRTVTPMQPLKVADIWRGSNGAEATALREAEPALVTLGASVRPAYSGSMPKTCTQEAASSSPRTPASHTASPSAVSAPSAFKQRVRMTAEAMRAICARWSAPEDFASSQATGMAETARVHAATAVQSPGVLLDMTSSPGSARSEQNLTEQSPALAQTTIRTPHRVHAPGSLEAQLRAAAREAATGTIAEGGAFSMSKALEDDPEQVQGSSRRLGRTGVSGERLRDGSAVVSGSREPEVGDLAAALELEEATPGPAAPLRSRRVRAMPSSISMLQIISWLPAWSHRSL